jgi:hypothetical protein
MPEFSHAVKSPCGLQNIDFSSFQMLLGYHSPAALEDKAFSSFQRLLGDRIPKPLEDDVFSTFQPSPGMLSTELPVRLMTKGFSTFQTLLADHGDCSLPHPHTSGKRRLFDISPLFFLETDRTHHRRRPTPQLVSAVEGSEDNLSTLPQGNGKSRRALQGVRQPSRRNQWQMTMPIS